MAVKKLCNISEIRKLTSDIFSFQLDAGEIAEQARPGQFVHIKCGEGLLLRRPISICDADGGLLRIVFQVRGTGTQWLAERKVGEALDVLGPLGTGFQLPESGKVLLPAAVSVPHRCFSRRNPRRKGPWLPWDSGRERARFWSKTSDRPALRWKWPPRTGPLAFRGRWTR